VTDAGGRRVGWQRTGQAATRVAALAVFCPAWALGAAWVPGAAAQDAMDPPDSVAVVSVEGEVLDAVTGLPVVAAVIVLPDLRRSTFSDDLGYFRFDDLAAGVHDMKVHRIGYESLDADVVINGVELLVVRLDPGPIVLEGIEVEVMGQEDLEWRSAGTRLGVIGPVEMEELAEVHLSLEQVLTGRVLSGVRFDHPNSFGGSGCLRPVGRSANQCVAVVLDGMLLGNSPAETGWVYEIAPQDIFAIRYVAGFAAGVRYGYAANAGVLEIETRVGRRR